MSVSKRPALEYSFVRFGWTRCALLALLTMCWWQPASGQVAARIAGMVTDSSGAPVASATVTAKNTETGAVRTAITDDAGRYQIVSLAIGP
ncbi:MAG TPA: carboxypeptidase-like regulatory domain-containing protein, partial [Candidatus Eremiobacteraceae bacterium]|nr:carboxypeptidase-like regulatory domain-containing protein [Candidatus Eremiobacteraceae bacterium]